MEHLSYNIGQIPFQDEKWDIGVGYVFIPSDIDREIFISDCFIRGKISIRCNDGGIYHNCPIDKSKFNDIFFPLTSSDLGSPIAYITEPIHKQPMIVAVFIFDNEIVDQTEDQFKIKKIFSTNVVEISGSAKDEYLTILVNGSTKTDFNIRLVNDNNKAQLNLEIDGDINVFAANNINITSKQQIIQKVGDDENNNTEIIQNSNEINARVNKFSVNEGNEPITLGNALKTILDSLFTKLGESTVTTSLGQMPLLNGQQIAALKNETEKILSKISFTD